MYQHNRLIDSIFPTIGPAYRSYKPATIKIDITEKDKAYVLCADVPGISKEELNVKFDDNVLTFSVVKPKEEIKKDDDGHIVFNERFKGNFTRSFQFPEDINGKKIKAKLKDGVLELQIPKKDRSEADKQRTIIIE